MITVVTVSTVTTIVAASVAASISIFATLMLIGFLVGKELLGTSKDNKMKLIARSLNIGIIPLVIGFTVLIGLKIAEMLA
jgi:hypothetical protein